MIERKAREEAYVQLSGLVSNPQAKVKEIEGLINKVKANAEGDKNSTNFYDKSDSMIYELLKAAIPHGNLNVIKLLMKNMPKKLRENDEINYPELINLAINRCIAANANGRTQYNEAHDVVAALVNDYKSKLKAIRSDFHTFNFAKFSDSVEKKIRDGIDLNKISSHGPPGERLNLNDIPQMVYKNKK